MTISSTDRVDGPYPGTGAAVPYLYSFKVFADSDILAEVVTAAGVRTTLNPGLYTVFRNANQDVNPGGTVTATVAVGSEITLTTQVPELQPVDITNNGGFFPSVINAALDRLTILVQQISSRVTRSLQFPISDTNIGTLPVAALRANQTLIFDANGDPGVGGVTGSLVSAAMQPVVAAATLAAGRAAFGVVDVPFTLASASGPASLDLAEDTDNGTNTVTLSAPASLAANAVVTTPGVTGTLAGSNISNAWSGQQSNNPTALTDAATIASDFSLNNRFTVTLAGNRTLGSPTNALAGQSGSIRITQDATGSRTLAYNSSWKWAGGSSPLLSTAANAIDILYYEVLSSTFIHASLVKDIK